MSYREFPAPGPLRELAECLWVSDEPRRARVLPDGCMDLIEMDDSVVVAGPDTSAFVSESTAATGIRFRPGMLPRLLGVPAVEVRDSRVDLKLLRPKGSGGSLLTVAARLLRESASRETAPWRLPALDHVTQRLYDGAAVQSVADEIGSSARNLQRHCAAVYGYGPATLRRILRFRKAVRLLDAGVPGADAAALAGYADQAHLSRQVHELAGVPASQLGNEA